MVAGLREHLNKKYQLVELNGEATLRRFLAPACRYL